MQKRGMGISTLASPTLLLNPSSQNWHILQEIKTAIMELDDLFLTQNRNISQYMLIELLLMYCLW